MNPVNEHLGPFVERALEPLVRRDLLRTVYGGGEEGAHLVLHPEVDDVHVTGSAETFDRIVWGPPGPERERRRRDGDPLLTKTISSELGNVTPVVVVPGRYADRQLRFQARAVASAVVNNASFNCNAAKMLVVSEGWQQREAFQQLLTAALAEAGTRLAYYPGALGRYEDLLAGRAGVQTAGEAADGALAWAFVPGLDPGDASERLFSTEPFCGIISEAALPDADPVRFLDAATRFCNERLWGTLCAEVVAPRDPDLARPVEDAVRELRYGTVGVNVWPAVSYAVQSPPWGGHGSATPADIQSGLGWVHNTYLLDGIDKAVFRAPLVPSLKPVWHFDHRTVHEAAPDLVELERAPGWPRLARVAIGTMRG
jgi:aldehyde dehydrogenase (NAD(P)+)